MEASASAPRLCLLSRERRAEQAVRTEPSSSGHQPKGALGLCPTRERRQQGDREAVSHRQALVTREPAELSLLGRRGELCGAAQSPDVLVPLRITADGDLKYPRSLSARQERKRQAEDEAHGDSILLLCNFISTLNRKQI